MMKKDHTFTASDGERLAVSTCGQIDRHQPRCVIYVHGFKGFKDWGFVPYIGEFLSQREFFVVTFNFSHNGIGADPLEFTELEKFERNTLSREVRELSEIIDACRNGQFGPSDGISIGLLGHSRGGGITLLTAAQKPEISAVVTWSSVATFDRYPDETKRKWRQEGYIEVLNQRTGQIMRLGLGLLNDFEQHKDGLLNIKKAVKNLHRPLLIIHGDNDESVPVDEAHRLYDWADRQQTRLIIIPGAGHTFDAKHPFEGSNRKLEEALVHTAEFFDAHMPV
jgi:pimeloyl-ACP methyl ester carboxylesterase